jgi:hypothetical protein
VEESVGEFNEEEGGEEPAENMNDLVREPP